MDAKVQSTFEQLEASKKWFLDLCAEKKYELTKPLGRNEWSIAEVVEHLVIAERRIVPLIENASEILPPPKLPHRVRRKIVGFILTHGIKVPTASEAVVPTGKQDIETSLREWEELRGRLKSSLEKKSKEDLKAFVFKHPRAGNLDVEDGLSFLGQHLQYHIIRTKKLLS